MDVETPKFAVGINHPDSSFTEPLIEALSKKGIGSVVLTKTDEVEEYSQVDVLILEAKKGFEVPKQKPAIFIDEPSSEEMRSEWAARYLDEGAVDYFPSNTNIEVIASYLKNLLNRGPIKNEEDPNEKSPMVFRNLSVDVRRQLVYVGAIKIELKKKEFDLLAYLIASPGEVFSREKLCEEVWGYDFLGETRAIDVCAERLRKKISGIGSEVSIVTVRGLGYGLVGAKEVEKLK